LAKLLICGDPHTMISNLEDSQKLLDFILENSIKHKVDGVIFTGDLFHNHAVVRIEILNFWRQNLIKFENELIPVIIIAGNHDMVGDKSKEGKFSAVTPLSDIKGVDVVDTKSTYIFPDETTVAFRAYTSDHSLLINDCAEMKKERANYLIAHQTFTGATYANGFYATDGIDPSLIAQDFIISGHIHTSMQIGNCFYVGSPKADNMADANIPKGVWVMDFKPDGSGYSKEFISTDSIVTCYKKYKILEGEEVPELDFKNKNYLELEGSNAWIVSLKKKFKGVENLQIKAIPTDVKLSQNTNKELKTINDFLKSNFKPIDGISIEEVQSAIQEVG
jgi:DNA repair exonuclease SbcCD nuclease subunit